MTQANRAAIGRYLGDLWPDGLPESARLTLYDPESGVGQFEDLGSAVSALAGGRYRYLTMALMPPMPGGSRGGAEDALALPGLLGDIDCLEGNHKEGPLPAQAQALEFLESLPLSPTIILHSGGGLYPVWLFREPLIFDTADDRNLAAEVSRGWWALVTESAKRRGWIIDNTSSLAQVLRSEGSINEKYRPPRLVRRIAWSGVRFNVSDFEAWCVPAAAAEAASCELPAELPASIRLAAESLHLGQRIKQVDGRIQAIILDVCPVCHGLQSTRRGMARETAHITPLSGRLKCKRQTCSASGDGLTLHRWTEDLLDSATAHEVRRQRSHEFDVLKRSRFTTFIPEGAETVDLATADEGRLQSLIEEAVDHVDTRREIGLVVSPVGGGKTRATCNVIAKRGRAAYFAQSHALLDEAAQQLEQLEVEYVRVEGVGHACKFPDAFRKYGRRPDWRGTACQKCPYLADKSCGAWSWMSGGVDSKVILGAHESLAMLREYSTRDRSTNETRGLLDGRDIFLDEESASVDVVIISREALRVPLDNPSVFGIQAKLAIQVTERLEALITHAVWEFQEDPPEHGKRWEGDSLHLVWLAAIEGRDSDALLSLVRRAAALEGWPKPDGNDLRHQRTAVNNWPHPNLQAIWRALPGIAEPDREARTRAADERGRLEVLVEGGRAQIELRRPRRIPLEESRGAVICDATGSLTRQALEAANPGVPVKEFALNVAPNPQARVSRIHLSTKSATRKRLCLGDECSERGLGMLRNVLRFVSVEAARVLSEGTHCVALLTYMAIAVQLISDRDLLESITPMNLRLTPESIGYYGLDDRGSNRFQDMPVLITLGDPIANIGATEADARTLGVDAQELIDSKAHASLIQAQGRSRALRAIGPKLLLHVGRLCPADGDWVEQALPMGRPASDEPVAMLVRRLLGNGEIVATPLVEGLIQTVKGLQEAGRLSRDKTAYLSLVGSFVVRTRTLQRWVERAAREADATDVSVRLGRASWKVWRPAAMTDDSASERAWEAWNAIQGAKEGDLGPAERWLGRLNESRGRRVDEGPPA